ncbi:MAG: hypothetical protein A3F16_00055 [Deltaproteobacteria bacterium RIFCSPHIGHO2_12_FULL_43_9]|nr:MAG: hypothetical protein A3F16_00055 [Deltaproteobacteria bacterium RIFCSPHIGHO2_12_FULL_43_9]
MTLWVVNITKTAAKELEKLPKEIREISAQLRIDLKSEGPIPKGWIVKMLKGEQNMYSVRLKREYRLIYQVQQPNIIIIRIAHRKDVYRNVY